MLQRDDVRLVAVHDYDLADTLQYIHQDAVTVDNAAAFRPYQGLKRFV